jgi:hypothetical protein
MPRPKRSVRPVEKSISLPEDLTTRIDLILFSELEGKVPHGAWARFVEGLIRKHLSEQEHTLAFLNDMIAAKIESMTDRDDGHRRADTIMENVLIALGQPELVEQFRLVKKWYG